MRKFTLVISILILANASVGFGQENFSLIFDGIDDHVEVPYSYAHFLLADFTVELMVFMEGGNGGRLISQVDYVVDDLGDEAYSIYLDSAGYIYFDSMAMDMPSSPHTAVSTTPLTFGQWNHIAITFVNFSSTKSIYLNGVQVFNEAGVGDVAFDNESLFFGGRKDSNGVVYDTFAGRLDEIRIWDTVRTQQEILDNMNQTLTGSETGLRGLWNFDEGQGSVTQDASPFGTDGVIVGALWANFVGVDPATWGGLKAMFR